jgi:hypothetical protein
MASSHCRRLRGIDRSAPSAKFRKMLSSQRLPRRAALTLVQLRTSHFPLNGYLHARGLYDTPLCPNCADRKESVFHFLMLCPAYARARGRLRSAFPTHSIHIAKLLAPGDHTKGLMKFIANSGRSKTAQRELPNNTAPASQADASQRDDGRAEQLRAGHNFWIQMGWAVPLRRSQSPLPTIDQRGDG